MKTVFKAILAAILIIFLTTDADAGTRIKIATLAPEGTSWMKVMNAMAAEVKEKTGGDVQLKFYSGGVMGDEGDVIRKMKFGQIQGGGFTGRGLGEINPEERVLELPMLFKNDAEVDCVLKKVTPRLAKGFLKKGFVMLGWAEVGHIYIFANKPVTNKKDLQGLKMWMWEGDPLSKAMFEVHDLVPVPLDLPNVLTSMQTGLIDAIYNSPYATVALQWHTRVKYMADLKLAYGTGALLITKKQFKKLTTKQQKILKEVASKHLGKLTTITRQENKDAMAPIKKAGIKVIQVKDADKIEAVSSEVYQSLSGKLYSSSFLKQVLKYRDACRAGK
jgi:TRAP-type C4-dicarboxylate transport system substrate-binding protein